MRILSLTVVLFLSLPVFTQDETPAPGAINLAIVPSMGEPTLVEIEFEAKGEGTVTVGGRTQEVPTDQKGSIRFVDEYLEAEGKRFLVRRRYEKFERSDSGECTDPGLDGATVRLLIEDGVPSLALGAGRLAKSIGAPKGSS